jgi:hypothetical protein
MKYPTLRIRASSTGTVARSSPSGALIIMPSVLAVAR